MRACKYSYVCSCDWEAQFYMLSKGQRSEYLAEMLVVVFIVFIYYYYFNEGLGIFPIENI